MLSDDASADPFLRWAMGVVCPVLPLIIGLMVIHYEHTYFLGGKPLRVVEYYGATAIMIGAGWVATSVFLHGHYFWSASRRCYFISELLKPIALFAIVACAVGVLVSEIVFG